MKKVYVRFGKPPEDGRSKIYRNCERVVGVEIGVSVYEAIEDDTNEVRILLHSVSDSACGSIYGMGERPAYIVEGNRIGTGSDGEPLLDNCRVIREVKLQGQNILPEYKRDNLTQNKYYMNNKTKTKAILITIAFVLFCGWFILGGFFILMKWAIYAIVFLLIAFLLRELVKRK